MSKFEWRVLWAFAVFGIGWAISVGSMVERVAAPLDQPAATDEGDLVPCGPYWGWPEGTLCPRPVGWIELKRKEANME